LTLALALVRREFRVVLLEQAQHLTETGAGIQLSPNATGILAALGLMPRLEAHAVAPAAIRAVRGSDARAIVRVPLARDAAFRYGAPYWVIHRADLQAALLAALEAFPDAVLRLGARVEDYAVHANGVTVTARTGAQSIDDHGIALVGADGLWSTIRQRLGDRQPPRFRRRTAWRATVETDRVARQVA